MAEYGFCLTRIFPYKDIIVDMSLNGKTRVKENPYLCSLSATQICMVTLYVDGSLSSFLCQLVT